MKFINDKFKYLLTAVLLAGLSIGCEVAEVDDVLDPNRPSANSVVNNASRGQIQDLVTGMETINREPNDDRNDMTVLMGVFGREIYYFNSSDPNFITAWLQLPGSVNAENEPSFFVDASLYEEPYEAVRHANLLILAANNTDQLSDQEKNAVKGFAKTLKGLQLLTPLNSQFQNGIRVDVPFEEPLNPGPFLGYDEALAQIRAILDDGAADLANGGSSFPFTLTDGLSAFNTPALFREVNRAIAARAAAYAEDWQGVMTALNNSFLDLNADDEADMNVGAYYTFNGGNDLLNPFFFPPNADPGDLIVVHPSMNNDALANDERVDIKFEQRTTPATNPDLSNVDVDFQYGTFDSATDDFPIIRNEELILLYAEAQAQLNNPTDAVNAIDQIRTTWGVGNYTGATDLNSLIDEILFQRRYSLWGEGHRWIDARRYDRLGDIPTALDGGRIPTQIARPQAELDWEDFIGSN